MKMFRVSPSGHGLEMLWPGWTASALTVITTLTVSVTALVKVPPQGHGSNSSLQRTVDTVAPVFTPPFYLLPLFGTYKCSEVDGYLCGIGLRFYGSLYLAHEGSMNKVFETYNAYHNKDQAPSVFNFHKPVDIEIQKENTATPYYWYPARIKPYNHDFALYKTIPHDVKNGFPATQFGLESGQITQFEYDITKEPSDCEVIAYGGSDANTGPSTVSLRQFKIRLTRCDGDLCYFQYRDTVGYFCGIYSDLGAPITCGSDKIVYVVHTAGRSGTPSDVEDNCIETMTALKTATFAKDNWEDIKRFYDKESWKPVG